MAGDPEKLQRGRATVMLVTFKSSTVILFPVSNEEEKEKRGKRYGAVEAQERKGLREGCLKGEG